MKEITLRVSDKKVSFFIEIVEQLGLEVIKESISVPQWQIEQVRQSKQDIKEVTAELTEWKSLKKDLFEKYNA
jgi:hypothetical protein